MLNITNLEGIEFAFLDILWLPEAIEDVLTLV